MATYKVLQDIEAEDKFVGPLTLRQFIYAMIAAACLYLSFWALTKHVPFFLIVLLPPALFSGLLAWPWSRDQPTEVWILAKVRFALKPRRRVWDQAGVSELVTITVPKRPDKVYTNDLTQTEVRSRLKVLANTIDSRGWAIKNVNVNLSALPAAAVTPVDSDRLVGPSAIPQDVASVDIQPADDILDARSNPVAQHLDEMIKASDQTHRDQAIKRMQQIREGQTPNDTASQDLWFLQPQAPPQPPGYATFDAQTVTAGTPPQGAKLTPAEEKALLAQLHPDTAEPHPHYGHMKVIRPLTKQTKIKSQKSKIKQTAAETTPKRDPIIQQLAGNDDLNVDTIARQANKAHQQPPDDEVVISLH